MTCLGYGFVDYDSTDAAEAAIRALQSAGIQAQLAKVRQIVFYLVLMLMCGFICYKIK